MPAASTRIVIAGLGLISPLGHSAWSTFRALLDGRTLADRCANLPVDIAPVGLVRAVGSVNVAQHTNADPTVELAERAAREAATDAGVELRGLPTYLGTGKGAVGVMTNDECRITDGKALAVALGPHGYLTHHLQRRAGIAPVTHAVAACASSLVALHQARRGLLHDRSNIAHRTSNTALVLTSEAALLPLFIHSYRKLGVLAPLTPGNYRQLPLDERRHGFMPSELAAAVVLKRTREVRPGEIELLDTAVACEACDMVRPSPTMTALQHVAERMFARREIDVIHPHAPGTPDHDPTELRVYAKLLRPHASSLKPDYYAVKGALGHGLGAAGLVSLVIACLCARTGKRPAMPWLSRPIDKILTPDPCPLTPASTHAIFASGFAGHVAGAVIQRK